MSQADNVVFIVIPTKGNNINTPMIVTSHAVNFAIFLPPFTLF